MHSSYTHGVVWCRVVLCCVVLCCVVLCCVVVRRITSSYMFSYTKIDNFNVSGLCDKDILGLNVSVYNSL